MHLLYFAFFVSAVSGSNRFTKPSFKAINFARAIIGQKLNGSVINETEMDSEISCQFACVKESRCLSYNFGPTEDKKRFKCQLSDSDRFVGLKNFTEDSELIYRGIQKNKMHLLYFAFFVSAVSGSNRFTKPSFKAINFARAIIGQKLNGSVINETEMDSEISCQFACVKESRCLSYNFGLTEDKKRFKCQLSDSDRFVGLKNFTEDSELIYRGIQKNKMHLLYFAFFVSAVSGSNRFTKPSFKAINFARAIIRQKLNGSVINETEMDSEISCQFACVKESRCLSYNFGPTEDKKRFKCQLSDSDRFVGLKNFTEDSELIYRGIQKNKMHLLYFAFFVSAVSGSNRFTKPSFKAINFARAIIGQKLNGSVINETEMDSEISCQFACVKESRCLSYNFGLTEDKKRFKCQLSDSDRFVGLKNFTEDSELIYRGIQKNKMHLLYFAFFVSAVSGSNRFTKPSFKAINFARAIIGQKLNGSVINETEMDSEISCQFACVKESRCLSYNFGPTEDKKRFKSESARDPCRRVYSASHRFPSNLAHLCNFTKTLTMCNILVQLFIVLEKCQSNCQTVEST
ncbi:hypothetical protein ACROYT_G004329 [Oculina patagonica]